MSNMIHENPGAEAQGIRQPCEICGDGIATWSIQSQEFAYGVGDTAVTLTAKVPVWSCPNCEIEYLADGAEAVRHEAVCRHLDRLTPVEIRQIRSSAGMTQARFAEELNVGLASLKRWELGTVIPNASTNALLREFAVRPRAAMRLAPQFKTSFSPEKLVAAGRFKLRYSGQARATLLEMAA